MAASRGFGGKTVLISGAAGGLGQALGRRFGRAGARLGLLDLDAGGLERLERELRQDNVESLALPGDVTDEDGCREAVSRLVERYGSLDALVNCAGLTHRSAFALTSTAVFRKVMEVNFFGSLLCTRAALPHLLQSRGLIVVISSVAGFAPLYGRTGYAASKHALHGLFDSLRSELRDTGVGVLIVCPGFVDTQLSRRALDGDGTPTTHPRSTVGRLATPAGVAEAVFRAAERDRRLLVLSAVGRLTRLITRLSPALYDRLMARSLKSELRRE